MALGRRADRARTQPLWLSSNELPKSEGHPFYRRLNQLLETHRFDEFVEEQCAPFYAGRVGRPGLPPGTYFRMLLIGYFEGLDSERGIAWRAADSLGVRGFLGLGLEEDAPDHSTISRTRRLIDLETHQAVFTWMQQRLVESGLLKGKTVAIDATTLEANAAMRSIVRRDSGERYQEYLTRLAEESGIETPTREDLAQFDRKRKKKASNADWRAMTDSSPAAGRDRDDVRRRCARDACEEMKDAGAMVTERVPVVPRGHVTIRRQPVIHR